MRCLAKDEIWQMDVFHFFFFCKVKICTSYNRHVSGFQWATALSSEKAESVITHLLEVMAVVGTPA